MFDTKPGLLAEIRDRFAHVEQCPYQGNRVFLKTQVVL